MRKYAIIPRISSAISDVYVGHNVDCSDIVTIQGEPIAIEKNSLYR